MLQSVQIVQIVHKVRPYLANGRPVGHELAVHAVQHGLDVVSLAGVLCVEQVYPAADEGLVNVPWVGGG